MLARLRKSMEEKDQGFTLVELLVVMIIIGILAAIAIPVFLNQRAAARDSATKSDVSTIGKEIAAYYVDGKGPVEVKAGSVTGTLVVTDTAGFTTENIKLSNGTTVPTTEASKSLGSATEWCVALTNADGGKKTFNYSAKGGLTEGGCK